MKKLIACLLALPLALSACGAQNAQSAATPAPAAVETEQTTETSPAENAAKTGITGEVRVCSAQQETSAGVYTMNESYDESAQESSFCITRTDLATAAQEKLASLRLDGGFYGMAAWDDTIELYMCENINEETWNYWRYVVDTATGSMEQYPLESSFLPTWYDDATVYQENRPGVWIESFTCLDRATGELTEQSLPAQIYTVYGAVDGRWLLARINSAAPIPAEVTDEDIFNTTWQNATVEYILYDPASGAMEKLYECPTTGVAYDYCGQRDGSLYFIHFQPRENDDNRAYPVSVDKLENGEMVTVYTLPQGDFNISTTQQQGTLRWIDQMDTNEDTTLQIIDLADGQTYTPSFKWDKVEGWNAGYPRILLANGQVLVSNGSYTADDGNTHEAYALIDCDAYLAGSTDYTPVAMYTGE